MKSSDKPKIILNEGFIDLRNCTEKVLPKRNKPWTKNSNSDFKTTNDNHSTNYVNKFPSEEKELVSTGLKKLVSSYNARTNSAKVPSKPILKGISREKSLFISRVQRPEKTDFKSKSELSVAGTTKKPKKAITEKRCSSPMIISETDDSPKVETPISRFTMTKLNDQEKVQEKEKSIEELLRLVESEIPSKSRLYDQPQWKDSRLAEKYSVLKVPWRRTYTLPVFSKPSIIVKEQCPLQDFVDRKTYLYDDGTEVDSVYMDQKKKSYVFQNHFMLMLFVCGTICGILLVSLIIWFVFGTEVLHLLLRPKEVKDGFIKRYAKFLGGSIIHLITTIVKTIGKAFSVPTHRVFQPSPEFQQWPGLH